MQNENKQTIPSSPQTQPVSGEFTTGLNNLLNIKRPKTGHKQFQVHGEILWKLMHKVQTVTVCLYGLQNRVSACEMPFGNGSWTPSICPAMPGNWLARTLIGTDRIFVRQCPNNLLVWVVDFSTLKCLESFSIDAISVFKKKNKQTKRFC